MSQRYGCDCGAVYSSVDERTACANRNHGRTDQRRICGAFFGPETLLPGTKPGTGLQRACLLFQNHPGEHSGENPELSLYYEEDEYERPLLHHKELD